MLQYKWYRYEWLFISILQANLYPTVGLQTPGEIVEANFGRSPFIFDIENYVQVVFVYIQSVFRFS